MILKLEQDPLQKNIEVTVKYSTMDKIVKRIVSLIKNADAQITCKKGDGVKLINVSDIYYIESVNKTAVIFCEKENFQTEFRLYQLNEKLKEKGFVQISKYCILNIARLDSVRQLFNSRMEAIL